MAQIKFADILRDPHFSQFSALLSVPFRSYVWRQQHPEVPFWILWENCTKWLNDVYFAQISSRQEFSKAFQKLLDALIKADPKLFYREEDNQWFIDVMDGDRALVTMSMLFAYASSKDTYLTPVQVAEATGTAESTWRNKAAAGEIIGAYKAGKQWLISVTSLRAYGINVDTQGVEFDENEEEKIDGE